MYNSLSHGKTRYLDHYTELHFDQASAPRPHCGLKIEPTAHYLQYIKYNKVKIVFKMIKRDKKILIF
jgi:hypothetical protein